jgi:hypothetical protein
MTIYRHDVSKQIKEAEKALKKEGKDPKNKEHKKEKMSKWLDDSGASQSVKTRIEEDLDSYPENQ